MTDLKELYAALAKAQGKIEGASKDRKNDHFKSKYADLASVWDAIRAPLSDNGLCVVQLPELCPDGKMVLRTILAHSTGAQIETVYPLNPVAQTPQGYGSAITYARRYTLMAITGVAPEDDDGNAASGVKLDAPLAPETRNADPSTLRIYRESSARIIAAEAKRRYDTKALQNELWQCQDPAEVAMFIAKHQADFDVWPITWLQPFEDQIIAHEKTLADLAKPRAANGRHAPQSNLEAG